jgi:DNA polymerase III alpha subunit
MLRGLGAVPAAELPARAGRRVKVAGLLVCAKPAHVRRTGERMKFLTLEDETALCEVTLFPRVYQQYGRLLLTRGPYLVTGRVENDHGALSVTAEELAVI